MALGAGTETRDNYSSTCPSTSLSYVVAYSDAGSHVRIYACAWCVSVVQAPAFRLPGRTSISIMSTQQVDTLVIGAGTLRASHAMDECLLKGGH